ncbi:MAG: cation transporter [Firmicutes bacterium]|nr:cation transporter [Bacillota bacterium]
MSPELQKGTDRRQKTLLASLLLSLWAPLATGIAVFLSHSITQVADFVRRTLEFLVLLLSWLVFRYLTKGREPNEETKKRWERIVNLSVALALGASGLVMLFLAFFRFQNFRPGGNVIPGLVIAVLGFIVNLWFWQRYSALERESPHPIIGAQCRLYLAKIFVDTCVILALGAVAFLPAHAVTRHIDALGSVAVSMYLLWSPWRTLNVK